jgi:hypothetical protein
MAFQAAWRHASAAQDEQQILRKSPDRRTCAVDPREVGRLQSDPLKVRSEERDVARSHPGQHQGDTLGRNPAVQSETHCDVEPMNHIV